MILTQTKALDSKLKAFIIRLVLLFFLYIYIVNMLITKDTADLLLSFNKDNEEISVKVTANFRCIPL